MASDRRDAPVLEGRDETQGLRAPAAKPRGMIAMWRVRHEPAVPDGAPRRRNRARLAAVVSRVALLCGTLLLLLATLEVGTRLFSNVVPPLTVPNATLGKTYRPGFAGRVFVDEAERMVELRFNREGFRGPDLPYEKPPGVRRVAVLGDSMVAAIATDEEQTMVAQLERLLNQSHPQQRFEVMNFGVSGASPGQALALYRQVVAKYQPDIVLCAFFVGNDLSDISSRLSTNPRIYFDLDAQGELFQEPYSVSRAAAGAWLNEHSRFYVWQKLATNNARHGFFNWMKKVSAERNAPPPTPDGASADPIASSPPDRAATTVAAGPTAAAPESAPAIAPSPAGEASAAEPAVAERAAAEATAPAPGSQPWLEPGETIFCTAESPDVAHAWRLTGAVFAAFEREVSAQGGLFGVIAIPVSKQIYDDQFGQLLSWAGESAPQFDARHPDRRLAGLCRDLDIPLVLMTDAFRAAAPHHSAAVAEEWLYLARGAGHFNDAGNRLAAEQVHRFLVEGTADTAGAPFVARLK